jgi:Holliday junction resolvase RusA-like endonuclease
MITIPLTPVPSPRMTRSDKWANRPCVTRYFAFRNEFVLKCNLVGYSLQDTLKIDFIIPMPKSWSEKERVKMDGQPHKQTPDTDNMVKSVCDAFNKDDGFVYDIHARKFWGRSGKIIIYQDAVLPLPENRSSKDTR